MPTFPKALSTELAELLPLLPGYKERKTPEGYNLATSVRIAEAHAEFARRAAAKTVASIAPAAPTPTAPMTRSSLWDAYHLIPDTDPLARRAFWKRHERDMTG